MKFGRFDTKMNADLNFYPQKSQVFLSIAALVSGASLFIGFFFLWHKPSISWVPILIGFMGLLGSFVGWFRAQPQTDLESASKTALVDKEAGLEIHTDSRTLVSKQAVQAIGQLFTTLAHRQPLPEPDGMVGSNGEPIPDAKEKAAAIVRDVNAEAEANLNDTAQTFSQSSSGAGAGAEQPNVVESEAYRARE